MPQITFVRPDNLVLQDGEAYTVDCSHLSQYVRVIQFDTERGEGWIEFVNDSRGIAEPNQPIYKIEGYQWLLDGWRMAKEAKAAEAKKD